MPLTMRLYREEEDYWRIRAFLREVFEANGRRELSWQAYRFDYWRCHGLSNLGQGQLERDVFLWEATGGALAAVLNREEPGHAYLQVHPVHGTPELEEEMIEVAERRLAVHWKDGRRRLWVWTQQAHADRQAILARRGYRPACEAGYDRRRPISAPIDDAPLPPGYTIRALGEGAELLERCYASGLAFHDGDIQVAAENRADVTWYRNIQNAPLYRRDLDIVAVAPDGAIASFCTIWFDDVTRTGAFEPVATAPAHRKRGLGKAVLCEGLRRLRRMGATDAFVGSYELAAHALYSSAGFTEYELTQPWVQEW
jgi:mycothiol synthase